VTQYAPGWYPDPSGSSDHRWFDGVQWTATTAPAPPQQFWTAPVSAAGTSPLGLGHSPHTSLGQPTGTMARNRYTAITAGIAALYLLLAITVHVALIGILPIVMSLRAFRAKEPLAPLSAVIAGISLIVAITLLVR
jgi:hypothetical protein